MNEILVRLHFAKTSGFYEILADSRVTIREIIDKLKLEEISYAYEIVSNAFADMDTPLSELCSLSLVTFYLF